MIRVWFSCFTTYQLFNALYYSMKVEWGNSVEKSLVWINDTKSDIDIEIFKDSFNKIYHLDSLPDVGFMKRQLTKCLNGGRLFDRSVLGKDFRNTYDKNLLICFSDQHYVTNKLIMEFKKLDSSIIVLLEEGVSTYVMDEKHKDRFTNRVANYIWGLHSQQYIGENNNIDSIIVKNPEKLPIQKKRNRLVIKQNNIFCDRTWAEDICHKYLKEMSGIETEKPIFLWIGQYLGGDYIDESREMQILDKLFSVMSENYYVIVKPHPREPNDRYTEFSNQYDIKVIDHGKMSWFPIELLWRSINPDAIASPWSSAAYNIYQSGFNGKVIYCYQLFGMTVGTDYFAGLSQEENIYNISSLSELKGVLSEPSALVSRLDINKNEEIAYFNDLIKG